MVVNVRPLQDSHNKDILNAIRNEASTAYQQRIPEATQANIQDTVKSLAEYRPHFNEFLDALVNRIGSVVARNITWSNPLREFKQGMLTWGDTIEEVQIGLLKAHEYQEDRETLEKDIFGVERPDVQSAFHTVNRQNWYKITVNEAQLHRAFLEPEGLSTFVSQLMQAPTTSDQWDEFLLTCSLFAEYESNGGFYHVNVPDVRDITSDAADARIALRKMRAMADNLTFLSTKYNASKMPTFAQREDLCLFVTPEFQAAIDVETLAAAFNMDKTAMHGRVIPIPEEQLGINSAQAIMTTKDFFVMADQRLENTSANNPVGLHQNYFLHHWEVISASRFVPAVMFWTGADDEVIEIQPAVTAVAAPLVYNREKVAVTTVERGEMYNVDAAVTTDPTGGDNTAVLYHVTGNESVKTYVTADGVLHIGGAEESDGITVTATSVWIDPANPSKPKIESADSVLTVTGVSMPQWPAAETFQISTAYTDGQWVTISGRLFEVTTAGTTAATVPDVSGVGIGETVTSNTAVFTRRA